LQLAGKLKDIPYRKGTSTVRRLTTGDAIMLATCLHLQDTLGVAIEAFHTFDDGGKNRELPLLSYHEWCERLTGTKSKLAARICSLKRERPVHPTPGLFAPTPQEQDSQTSNEEILTVPHYSRKFKIRDSDPDSE
jgi:hypothetical protein